MLALYRTGDGYQRLIAAGAPDDRQADRQTVDRGARDADLRHPGQPAVAAEAQQAVALRTRYGERFSPLGSGEGRGGQAKDRPLRQ